MGLLTVIGTLTESDKSYPTWRQMIIGQSAAILQICEIIELVASKRCTVLITGESGTGKEVIARALHAASPRSQFPMVAVNCTALPSSLIESELFGHAKGAFTGAHASRIGRFEQAHRGSIFLDEIGDLPLEAQAKLLRVLQEQEFQRIGSSETVRVDCRVIAASNVDLESAVRDRRFREDLYYRLNVVPVHLPPLRERREDIPLLLECFVQKISEAEDVPAKRISEEAIRALQTMDWPGNVRQLEHAVQMGYALSGDRPVLEIGDFRLRETHSERLPDSRTPLVKVPREGLDFDDVVSQFELSLLAQALEMAEGNKARAANLLKIKRTTLLAKMKSFEERARRTQHAELPIAIPSRNATRVVLVHEEIDSVRNLICQTLREEGYRVLEGATLGAMFELLECWLAEINVIISGAQSSRQVSEVLLRVRSRLPEVPAILLPASAETCQGFRDSRTRVVVRPFHRDDLLEALQQLERKESSVRDVICA